MKIIKIILTVAILSVFTVGCRDVSKSSSNTSGATCENCR